MENDEGWERCRQRIRDGGLLDVIRVRTVMYTGERTLSSVYHFLRGYQFALNVYVYETPGSLLPPDFHDWVAYRLRFHETTLGYRGMILKRFPDESAALDRFFELFDEHRSRQARVVATVRRPPGNPDMLVETTDGNLRTSRRVKLAEEIKIVVYTDDPGFFVANDDQAAEQPRRSCFCPALSWMSMPFRPDEEHLTILDLDQYNRLLREDEAFRQRRSEERQRRSEDWQRRRPRDPKA